MTTARFTTFGVIAVGLALWVFSQQATGDARKIFNMLLLVLLMSMVLLNWTKIGPIFFRQA
ncbi:MAG: hypothetical protein K6T83_07850 [Alicyclobacillus sp.]|nr:hypothetical protein [Alicyclobacillus sp.]